MFSFKIKTYQKTISLKFGNWHLKIFALFRDALQRSRRAAKYYSLVPRLGFCKHSKHSWTYLLLWLVLFPARCSRTYLITDSQQLVWSRLTTILLTLKRFAPTAFKDLGKGSGFYKLDVSYILILDSGNKTHSKGSGNVTRTIHVFFFLHCTLTSD